MTSKLIHSDRTLSAAACVALLTGLLIGLLLAPGKVSYRYITTDNVRDIYEHKGVTAVSYTLIHLVRSNTMEETMAVTVGDQRFSADSKEFGGAFLKVHQFIRDSYVVITPTRGE